MKEPIQLKDKDKAPLRAKLLLEQGGLCLVCSREPKTAVLDHSHKKRVKGTGLIRGVLCSNCNVFIAKSENNCGRYNISQEELPEILRSMADYLERPHLPMIHPSEGPKPKILQKSAYNKLQKVYRGRAKFPVYRTNAKGKPVQKLTKPLAKLFKEYGIEPTFYGENKDETT